MGDNRRSMRPPLYLLYRGLRRFLPPGFTYRFASRDTTPAETLSEDAWLYDRLLRDQGFSVRDKRIAEIGPGTLNPFAVLLLKRGAAHVDAIEPYPRHLDPETLRQRLKVWWQHDDARGDRTPWPEDLLNGPDFDPRKVTRHLGLAEALPLPDASVDLVVSTMVLQFIADPEAALREMHRILRPGGIMLHIVDLRDHCFKYPLEMLTFSASQWSRLAPLKEGRGWHNRLRLSHWLRHAEAAGFADLRSAALESNPDAVADIRARLHPDFSALTDADLSTTMAWFLGRKP
jgi:SAM-dependent methyltransferase